MKSIRGTVTALITPFQDGRVDYHTLERLVERQIEAGVDALVPCGTTGESPTLRDDEHHEVIACVIRAARGRLPVIAGTGTNDTAETVRRTRLAVEAGASAALVVNPYYNRPTQAGLFAHFAEVARSASIPIVLYNIPGRTGVELSIATIAKLHEKFPRIVAVKHATGRVDDAADLMQASTIDVLSGDDPLTWPLMALGAVGVVSVLSNLAPRAVKRLTDAALGGDFAAAREAHRTLFPLARALLSLETNPIPIKTAMALRGLCTEEFRLPMTPIAPENRVKLGELLERVSLD